MPQSPREKRAEEARKFLKTHPASMPGQIAGQSQTDKKKSIPAPDLPGAVLPNRGLSQQILVYHEPEPTEVGNEWMFKLKEDSMQFLADQKGVDLQKLQRDSLYKKAVESLVDKIFGILQRYTYEFNQIASGTDLHVTGSITGSVTEVLSYNKFREAEVTETFFRARLSTRFWALNLVGRTETVDFYLLPTASSMALSKVESEYKPLATMQVLISDQGMMWRMHNGIPTVESLDELCMWLFSSLVKETKNATITVEQEQKS